MGFAGSFVVVVLTVTPALAAPPEGCEAWTFSGYYIGMPKTEAVALRKIGKPSGFWSVMAPEGGSAHRVNAGGVKGKVAFDSHDRLVAWSDESIDVTFDAIRDRLDRLFLVRSEVDYAEGGRVRLARWESEACDSIVTALELHSPGLGSSAGLQVESLSVYRSRADAALGR